MSRTLPPDAPPPPSAEPATIPPALPPPQPVSQRRTHPIAGARLSLDEGAVFDDALLGKLLNGRYLIQRLLGAGGMARVYAAFDQCLAQQCAVKTTGQVYSERLAREVVIAAKLKPTAAAGGVAGVYERGATSDGRIHYAVFDFVAGQPLVEILDKRQPLPVDTVIQLGLQLTATMAAVHRAKIIHRDLTPSNIVVSGGAKATIVDFGIAYDASEPSITGVHAGMGTPPYVAPEQLLTPGRIDNRVDIYSLGMVLFHCLAGIDALKLPDRPTAREAVRAAERRRHIRAHVPVVSPLLASAIERAVALAPDDRFATMEDFHAALQCCAERHHPAANKTDNTDSRLTRTRRPLWSIAAAGSIGGALALAFLLGRSLPAAPPAMVTPAAPVLPIQHTAPAPGTPPSPPPPQSSVRSPDEGAPASPKHIRPAHDNTPSQGKMVRLGQ